MIDRNHPAVEAALNGYLDAIRAETGSKITRGAEPLDALSIVLTAAIPHLTADDLPARLVRDIQVRTLRAAARAAIREEDGIPWDHDWDRATVSAWLDEFADELEREGDA